MLAAMVLSGSARGMIRADAIEGLVKNVTERHDRYAIEDLLLWTSCVIRRFHRRG